MHRCLVLSLLCLTVHCGSFAARCGIWPSHRISGRAEAPAGTYWKSATVYTTHEKGYAGGHGGGTTFHTMQVKLQLYGGPNRTRDVILEKGTVPLTSQSDYVYALVSRDYDLKFSDDGTKLAITYDHKDYGYVALDTKSPAVLFYRERRFHPREGAEFWKAFPATEDYALELLANLQFTKAEIYRQTAAAEEPPYFRTIDSSSDDFVTDLTDRFLNDYPANDRIFAAALKGALEVSQQYPVSKERLSYLRENFTGSPAIRSEIHRYLNEGKMGVNALAYAAMILSANPNAADIPLLTAGLGRLTSEMKKSDSNYRTYHTWDYNRYLWAIAVTTNKIRPQHAKLTAELVRVLGINEPDMAYDVYPAQVYAIQSLAHLGAGRAVLERLAGADATKLADIWPQKYGDPQRDYCEWEEKYSDCKRSTLAAWARAAMSR